MSEHFSWEEVTRSSTARIKGIDNTLPLKYKNNVLRTMTQMERVRKLLGDKPLHVNSWYRSPELNKAVGGSATSAHMRGQAVDFEPPEGMTLSEAFVAIARSGIDFDQLIHEGTKDGADWIHIGFATMRDPRREVLTAHGDKLGGEMAFARVHVTTG